MIGHEWAVELLQSHIAHKRIKHAYLFTGPPGVGRRTLALHFSQAINCTQPLKPGIPCGECRTCRQFEHMQHADLSLVQASEIGGTLKVEQIREVQRAISLSPYEAKYRIALFLRFDEANINASNALLKVLEEPPASTILLLTAETPESLLPTIVSRCEILRLRPLSFETLSAGLQNMASIPKDNANFLAHISQGRPGTALTLYKDPSLLERRQEILDLHFHLLRADTIERFNYIKTRYTKKRENFRIEFIDNLQVWQSVWRDVLLFQTKSTESIINIDHNETIHNIAAKMTIEKSLKFISDLDKSIQYLDHYSNLRLTLEVLIMDMPHISF